MELALFMQAMWLDGPLHFLQEVTGMVVRRVDWDVLHDGWISWSMMKQKQTRQARKPEGLIRMQLRDRRVSWWGADNLEGGLSEIDAELPEKEAWTISTVGDLWRDPQVHPENLLAELLWWFHNLPNSKMSFFWRRNNVTHVAFGLKEHL